MIERNLPVQPQFGGELPPNLSVERVITQPETVKVKGPKTLLKGMANIATLPIDVTGRRTSFRERVELTPLALPEGLAQRHWVEVDVRIGAGRSVAIAPRRGVGQRPYNLWGLPRSGSGRMGCAAWQPPSRSRRKRP